MAELSGQYTSDTIDSWPLWQRGTDWFSHNGSAYAPAVVNGTNVSIPDLGLNNGAFDSETGVISFNSGSIVWTQTSATPTIPSPPAPPFSDAFTGSDGPLHLHGTIWWNKATAEPNIPTPFYLSSNVAAVTTDNGGTTIGEASPLTWASHRPVKATFDLVVGGFAFTRLLADGDSNANANQYTLLWMGGSIALYRQDGESSVLLATDTDPGVGSYEFGADAANVYVKFGGNVILTANDTTYSEGEFAIGGGYLAAFDNLTYEYFTASTPPTLTSAAVQANGRNILLTFDVPGTPPIQFSTNGAGITVKRDGVEVSSLALLSGSNTVTLTTRSHIWASNTATIDIEAGGIIDSADPPNEIAAVTAASTTNNSVAVAAPVSNPPTTPVPHFINQLLLSLG